jgi:ligand-binding SRPBCC domain-containing protein
VPQIYLATSVSAPIERCFDLARSVDAHVTSTAATRERVVGGRSSGLLSLGEEVTWEAVHFGVRQRFTARITEFERPTRFVDEMVRGVFARFRHVHQFRTVGGVTEVTDLVDYASPLGVLGALADALVVKRHLTAFLIARAEVLKTLAVESER